MRSSSSLWVKGLGFRHFAQDVEVIGHQNVFHDPNASERRPAAHQREKFLGLRTTPSGDPEDEEAMNERGNAVVKTPTLSFDSRKSHKETNAHNIYQMCILILRPDL
jgi:hypothetical protein